MISVITNDGRNIVVRALTTSTAHLAQAIIDSIDSKTEIKQGVLKGFDQTTNIILQDCHERVFSPTAGVEQVPLGLYIIRGDNMCVCVDRVRDDGIGAEFVGFWLSMMTRTPLIHIHIQPTYTQRHYRGVGRGCGRGAGPVDAARGPAEARGALIDAADACARRLCNID